MRPYHLSIAALEPLLADCGRYNSRTSETYLQSYQLALTEFNAVYKEIKSIDSSHDATGTKIRDACSAILHPVDCQNGGRIKEVEKELPRMHEWRTN